MKIPRKKLDRAIELGRLKRTTKVYDLGAGIGTIAFAAAYTGAYVKAVERNPILVGIMKMMLFYNKQSVKAPVAYQAGVRRMNVDIEKANLLDVDLSTADVVYCYLFPPLMQKIGEKAKKEMKRGAKIISVEHKINGWKPAVTDKEMKIYVYKIPTSFASA